MNAAKLRSVRDNAQATQDYLADLKNWVKDIKEEDKRLLALQKDKCDMTVKDSAPIRGQLRSAQSQDIGPRKKEAQSLSEVKEHKKRIQSSDYAAWDKYDAEAAVETIEKQTSKLACDDGRLDKDTNSTEATDEDKLKAIQLKDEGNRLYSAGQYPASVAQYSQGIALDPSNHILYANRAMAYIKLQRLEAAVRDCDACLRLSPNYLKAWLRRGAARLSLGQLQHALEDYQKVLEVEPWNKDAKEKVSEIKKKMTSTSPPPRSDSKKNNLKKSPNHSISTKVSSKVKEQKTSENSARRDEIAARLGKPTLAATDPVEADGLKQPPPNTDPDILQPASKPHHLRSQKPLIKLQVVDVASEADIPPLQLPKRSGDGSTGKSTRTSGVPAQSSPPTTDKGSKQPLIVELDSNSSPKSPPSKPTESSSATSKLSLSASLPTESANPSPAPAPSLPPLPRTSHQFMSSWSKVASHPHVAYAWLQTIKPSSIRGFELEADCIASLATTFTSWLDLARQPQAAQGPSLAEAVMVGEPASVRQMVRAYLEAVTESRAFELNALFLTSDDKKCFLALLSDLEADSDCLPPKLAATCQLLTE